MRCFTLAEGLLEQGAKVRFVSRDLPNHLIDLIAQKGMEFVALPERNEQPPQNDLPHSSWLGISQTQDALDTCDALGVQKWDWLVVDHYALDARWETALRNTAVQILAIDDLADRTHDCDVLLDQNYYSDMQSRYTGKTPANCRLLLGPSYALLRREFVDLRNQRKPCTEEVRRIIVFFGGIDADNFTGKTIEALAHLKNIAVDVVIGTLHPDRREIEEQCIAFGYTCHVQTPRMAQLMAEADLAIGAGGAATWERCCLGLPAFSICLADNQRQQLSHAASAGLVYAPLITGNVSDAIRRHTVGLTENPSLLTWLSVNSLKALDGLGVQRCIAEMTASIGSKRSMEVIVRPAKKEDAIPVWSWRNNEATRQYSFDQSVVSLEKHQAWWEQSLTNTSRILLIGEENTQRFGVLRFDSQFHREEALVSIYLSPEMVGRGMGTALILAGLHWLRAHRPEIRTVKAEILAENSASLRAFRAAGFSEEHRIFVWHA